MKLGSGLVLVFQDGAEDLATGRWMGSWKKSRLSSWLGVGLG